VKFVSLKFIVKSSVGWPEESGQIRNPLGKPVRACMQKLGAARPPKIKPAVETGMGAMDVAQKLSLRYWVCVTGMEGASR